MSLLCVNGSNDLILQMHLCNVKLCYVTLRYVNYFILCYVMLFSSKKKKSVLLFFYYHVALNKQNIWPFQVKVKLAFALCVQICQWRFGNTCCGTGKSALITALHVFSMAGLCLRVLRRDIWYSEAFSDTVSSGMSPSTIFSLTISHPDLNINVFVKKLFDSLDYIWNVLSNNGIANPRSLHIKITSCKNSMSYT